MNRDRLKRFLYQLFLGNQHRTSVSVLVGIVLVVFTLAIGAPLAISVLLGVSVSTALLIVSGLIFAAGAILVIHSIYQVVRAAWKESGKKK